MLAAVHIVVSGDTLYGIAQEYYGNGYLWPDIWHANPSISDPNYIVPGEKVLVPRHAGKVSDNAVVYSGKHSRNTVSTPSSSLSGTLSCSGLESLWVANGGNPQAAFIAAEIAKAESGGQQYATGGAGERGYWQINPVWGSLSTYDPNGNAKAAIFISNDGTNWEAWTTYTRGLYIGEC